MASQPESNPPAGTSPVLVGAQPNVGESAVPFEGFRFAIASLCGKRRVQCATSAGKVQPG